ncbi:hypothetical protein KSP39_PZI001657 [Platanthera zijinensis]|uniref:Protein KAKU4 n=1 Tax=Platanthera zijinensis TaxID=2320716 RepID=A0AAP0GDV1_9ASPA
MAFVSGSGQQEQFRSGGKILHGRRHLPRFSPYSRPSSSAAPLAVLGTEPQAGRSPNWFRGLISGAGKLISSVLGSEGSGSSPSECSSDYPSDEECDSLANGHEDQLLSDDLVVFNKRENGIEGNAEPLAIVSKSESKLVIEQLLLQETFTRDEYSKLMDIIRSRVLDIPSAEGDEGIQKVVPERDFERKHWPSFSQDLNISGPSNASPENLSAFSPRYYASEAVTPELRNRAVLEAKKWFKEKKLSPSTICDQECGPCILNTNMNQYHLDSDGGSPIDMAKSYMQSLPPWRSPSFSNSGFKNLSSSGKHMSCSSAGHLLLASKINKRDYSAIGSWHSSRRQIADEQRSSKLKHAGSATKNFSKQIQDISSDEPLRLYDKEAVEAGQLLNMDNVVSQSSIVEIREAFEKAQEIPKIAAENGIEHLHPNIASILPCDADILMSDKNQDVEMPSVSEVQIGSMSFPETETSQPENVIPAAPSIMRSKEGNFQNDNVVQANPDSDFKHAHSFTDTQPPDDNPHVSKEIIRAADQTNTNGNIDGINSMKFGLASTSKGGPTTTNSSSSRDVVAASASEGSHEPPTDVSSGRPSAQGIGGNAGRLRNGTKMKTIERIPTEPSQPGRGRGRRKAKKVVRQQKWKG